MPAPAASVIVRAKNKAATIEHVLLALRGQSVPVQIIVVDSGSADATVEIAKRHADVVINLAPEEFSYGHALNLGAEAATADIHFALSAHTVPQSTTWIAQSLAHYDNASVAATNGRNDARLDARGQTFAHTFHQTHDDCVANPMWGFSNTASSWRAGVWQQFRFDKTLAAAEDKEWSWRVLEAGWTIAYDPALSLSSAHRRKEGPRALYERSRKEARVLASLRPDLKPTLRDSARKWWSDFPYESTKPKMLRRLSPNRNIELLGRYRGARESTRASA